MIAERVELVQVALTLAVVWVTTSRVLGHLWRDQQQQKALEADESRRELPELPDDRLDAEFVALEAAVAARRAAEVPDANASPVDRPTA